MRLAHVAVRSFWHYLRTNGAIGLGIATATAVLVGALLVGDSMRGSLRQITLDRLGQIDDVLTCDHFFREALVAEWLADPGVSQVYSAAVPLIMLPDTTVEFPQPDGARRATQVTLFGLPPEAWQFQRNPPPPPARGQVVLNQQLAAQLGIDQLPAGPTKPRLTLRIGIPQALSSDSALGKTEDLIEGVTDVEVTAILPNRDLGRFDLRVSQLPPNSAFVSLAELQTLVGPRLWKGKSDARQANLVFLKRRPDVQTLDAARQQTVQQALQPALDDLGLRLSPVRIGLSPTADNPTPPAVAEYLSLSTDSLVFAESAAATVTRALPADAVPVFTYLANRIEREGGESSSGIPFSMIAGLDWPDAARPRSALGDRPIAQPAAGEIVLNSWAAEDLAADVGDTLVIRYFQPEAAHGQTTERQTTLRVVDIAALTRPATPFRMRRGTLTPAEFTEPPTLANDPDLTPQVPGLTDAATIENWDLPFETPGIRPADDTYWEEYRTTPKGFVSLATAQQLWGSRFGQITSFRIPRPVAELDSTARELTQRLASDSEAFGFQIQPLRELGLRAAGGSTPFDLLFLGLSLFVIGSALVLIGLLFRLALEQRTSQVGLLAAIGWTQRRITAVWLWEMLWVCLAGCAVGVALGLGYAWLLVWGLRTWWVGAIQVPFVELHVTGRSLILGAVIGGLIGLGTIAWTLIRSRNSNLVGMLRGQWSDEGHCDGAARRSRFGRWLVVGCALLAVVLLAAAPLQAGDIQAGLFVGGGFFVLLAGLLAARGWLRSPLGPGDGQLSVQRLGWLNARRQPLRSTLTMGLVAIAVFLIVAINAFRVRPGDFGTAGFAYVATSSQPLFGDLNTPAGRSKLLRDPAKFPADGTVLSFRYRSGDDASCNNPFQTVRPRVIGVPPQVVEYFDQPQVTPFRWAGFERPRAARSLTNPWRVLAAETTVNDSPAAIPAVLDKNTAYYSLKIFQLGAEFTVDYGNGPPVRFRLVGLLDNSILQGSILIAERDFVRLFPQQPGYRYFLLRAPAGQADQMLALLEDDLGDQGFDGVSAPRLLGQLLAVQNTYLSAFQSLGALGLLLGTLGLAAVVLRSVWERRRELGLLRAIGLSDRRLIGVLLAENLGLLLAGIAIGAGAALLAVIPHWLLGSATFPLVPLVVVVGLVAAVGWVTIRWAARSLLSTPILASLRSE